MLWNKKNIPLMWSERGRFSEWKEVMFEAIGAIVWESAHFFPSI